MSDVEQRLSRLQRGRPDYVLRRVTLLKDRENRLTEAAVWCERYLNLADVKNSLRPQRIAPRPLSTNRWTAVDDIATFRLNDLEEVAVSVRPAGRLMVYFPDADLTDGAAEIASEGFLDVYNAPPWGTWIGYFEDGGDDPSYASYLLAWVPDALVGPVANGIIVNPEQCIGWLTDSHVAIRSVIADALGR